MNEYSVSVLVDNERLKNFNRIFTISRVDGKQIDFNSEGIGFIPSIKTQDVPVFLSKTITEGSMSYEYSGFCFGPITEGEKVWLEKGLVEIYVMKDKTILSAKDFFELTLEFANKALEAVVTLSLKEKGIVDDAWIRSIEDSIPKLQAKLNEY